MQEPYEALIRVITYQHLTAKAGVAILARMTALCAGSAFPMPDQIVAAGFGDLHACGLLASKIATIMAIAQGAQTDLMLALQVAVAMADYDLIASITTMKGIGQWTVAIATSTTAGVHIHRLARHPRIRTDFNLAVSALAAA